MVEWAALAELRCKKRLYTSGRGYGLHERKKILMSCRRTKLRWN